MSGSPIRIGCNHTANHIFGDQRKRRRQHALQPSLVLAVFGGQGLKRIIDQDVLPRKGSTKPGFRLLQGVAELNRGIGVQRKPLEAMGAVIVFKLTVVWSTCCTLRACPHTKSEGAPAGKG